MDFVSSHIPYIPPLNDNTQSDIYNRKEFRKLKLKPFEKINPSGGVLLNHQEMMKRLMSSHNRFSRMLIFAEVGTGKTCTAVAVSEEMIKETYTAKTLVLVSNPSHANQFIQSINEKCTKRAYENLGSAAVDYDDRIRRNVKKKYDVETVGTFLNRLDKLSDSDIVKSYSDRVIIVDEVHTFTFEEKEKNNYAKLHKFLHLVENCKILLMSGTPMWDREYEIADVMNLLLPSDEQLPTKEEFTKQFFDKENNLRNPERLQTAFNGKITYLRAMQEGSARKNFKGDMFVGNIQVVPIRIPSDKLKEAPVASSSFSKIQVSYNTVQTDLKFEDVTNYLKATKTYSIKDQYKNLFIGDELKKISPKFYFIIQELSKEENSKKLTFIYNRSVTGIDGCIMLSLILELNGFSWVKEAGNISSRSRKNGFMTITDAKGTITGANIIKALGEFSSEENKYGKNCRIMIGSKVVSQGYNTSNIRQFYMVSPWWNISDEEQALGRVFRNNSFINLEPDERVCDIYRLCAIGEKDEVTIDYNIFVTSNDKQTKVNKIKRLCKEMDVFCKLNYDRNVLEGDEDGSKDCEYMECKYSCYNTVAVPVRDLITDAYNKWYSSKDIANVKKNIKSIFSKKRIVHINDILHNDVSDPKVHEFLVLEAILQMVNNKELVDDENILKEEGNYLFKTTSMTTSLAEVLDENKPLVREYIPFNELITLDIIEGYDCNEALDVYQRIATDFSYAILEVNGYAYHYLHKFIDKGIKTHTAPRSFIRKYEPSIQEWVESRDLDNYNFDRSYEFSAVLLEDRLSIKEGSNKGQDLNTITDKSVWITNKLLEYFDEGDIINNFKPDDSSMIPVKSQAKVYVKEKERIGEEKMSKDLKESIYNIFNYAPGTLKLKLIEFFRKKGLLIEERYITEEEIGLFEMCFKIYY